MADNRVTLGRRWGNAPVLCEGIGATIHMSSIKGTAKLYPLDERGERVNAVTIRGGSSGAKIALKPQFKTVWYELIVEGS